MASIKDIELEQLRGSNHRLQSTIQALKLEICYYQGEMKRVEMEKDKLKEDVTKMSDLFKMWLHELKASTRSIMDDSNFVKTLVKYPARHISDVLRASDDMTILTTAQAPFYVEYGSKTWSVECGWKTFEVLGHTCAFLQGKGTDLKTAAAFTRDVRETGYGHMRIHNYRKSGEMFACNVTVFPVYDTAVSVGPTSDEPILTHFAAILSNITKPQLTPDDNNSPSASSTICSSFPLNKKTNICGESSARVDDNQENLKNDDDNDNNHDDIDATSYLFKDIKKWGGEDLEERNSNAMHQSSSRSDSSDDSGDSSEHDGTSDENNSSDNDKSISINGKEKASFFKTIFAQKTLSKENFNKLATSSRLSDVLRLMVIIKDALVLTDDKGRILQVNSGFIDLDLASAESKLMEVVDLPEFKQSPIYSLQVGTVCLNIAPIRGGYMTDKITHYFAICQPDDSSRKRKHEEEKRYYYVIDCCAALAMSLLLFETDCEVLNYCGDAELNLVSLFSKILINESTIAEQQLVNDNTNDVILEARVVIGRGSPNFPVDVKIAARPHGKDIISRRHASISGKFQLLRRGKTRKTLDGAHTSDIGSRGSSPPSSCSLHNAFSVASEYYLEPVSFCIEDVGAVNGLFVNGYRVKVAQLHNNDIVQLGGAANCKFFDKIGSSDVNVKFQFKMEGHFHRVLKQRPKCSSGDSIAISTSVSRKRFPTDGDENRVEMDAEESFDGSSRYSKDAVAGTSTMVKRNRVSISSSSDNIEGSDADSDLSKLIEVLRSKLVERDDFIKQKTAIIERNGKTIKDLQAQVVEQEKMSDSFTSEIGACEAVITTLKRQLHEQQSSGLTTSHLEDLLAAANAKGALAEASLASRTRDMAALERALAEYKGLYAGSVAKVKALSTRPPPLGSVGTATVSQVATGAQGDLKAELLDSLKCGACLDIMVDASVLHNCSHGFCRSCVESLLRSSPSARCPVCNYHAGGAEVEALVGDSAYGDLYSRSCQLDSLCALAVERSSPDEQAAYAARTHDCSLSLARYGISSDLPCNWRQQQQEFDASSHATDADLAMGEDQFRREHGFLVLTTEEKAAIYNDAAGTTTAAVPAAAAPAAAAPAAAAPGAGGPRCYYCGSDDHDFDACEHFERVSDSSSSDGEEEEEEEEEGSEQSRDY